VPFVDRDLAGENGRATPIAFLEDFVEVTTGPGVERFEAPIVEDQELDTGETAQDAGIAAIAAGERELGEELGNPLVESRAWLAREGPSLPAQLASHCREQDIELALLNAIRTTPRSRGFCRSVPSDGHTRRSRPRVR
jgi:hypothetical protein